MDRAEIVADSRNIWGQRVTTFQVRFPRIILSEVLTHRVLAKNTGSSRAKPTNWVITDITNNPFIPDYWGKNQSGMQAFEELEQDKIDLATKRWQEGIDYCLGLAKDLQNLGVHKQLANRCLEWCQYIDVVITGTEFNNFFALRTHKDAQPEIQVLSKMMWDAYNDNKKNSKLLLPGQVHLPYLLDDEEYLDMATKKRICSARCARVSYRPFNSDKADIEADLSLFDKLVGNVPGHWSPLEHVLTSHWRPGYKSGPVRGFKQFRKEFKQENITQFKGY